MIRLFAHLFAHRGFWQEKNIPQNSVASLKSAYENKFRAVEFDIWFIDGKLLLKHEEPLPGEKLDFFENYLQFGNEFIYWLDFKNLNEANVEDALTLVRDEIEKVKINLAQCYFAPFITNYEIAEKILQKIRIIFGENVQFVAVCEDKESLEKMLNFLQKNSVKFLSIFHELLDKKLLKKLSEIEIFAWTVNDQKRLSELENLGIKNFATDKITPQIYGEKT